MKISKTAVILVSLGAATAALAHGTATGIVKERMDSMIVLRDSMKAIGPMMMGGADYNAAAVREQAALLRSHAGEAITKRFPEGSGGMPSEARDEIWEQWETFTELANRLENLSVALEKGAENGLMKDGYHGNGDVEHDTMQKMMEGEMPAEVTPEALAGMPADSLFMMIGKTCSACHQDFRVKKE